MKKLSFSQDKPYGFRLSPRDVAFIAAILVASTSIYVATEMFIVAIIPIHLCAVFFLFCNVFRVRTRQEAVWIVTYVASAFAAIAYDLPFWPVVLGVTTPALIGVTIWAMLTGGYHGAGYRGKTYLADLDSP